MGSPRSLSRSKLRNLIFPVKICQISKPKVPQRNTLVSIIMKEDRAVWFMCLLNDVFAIYTSEHALQKLEPQLGFK
jgi:hypothetical protein